MCKTDSRLPAGGVKNSGFRRDLGDKGIKEFVNIKTFFYKLMALVIGDCIFVNRILL